MESNQPPQFSSSPRTSATAIWSLVLGILGFLCFSFVTGIPAVICGHIAQGKIKRSGGALTGSGLAIAGLVTGYISIAMAIFVIPMLLAIAIPNFVKARNIAQQNICIMNLNQIDNAIKNWALETKQSSDAVPQFQDLSPYLPSTPVCPLGGVYHLGKVSEKPTCSIPGHALPPGE
jgi:hypothetical protein